MSIRFSVKYYKVCKEIGLQLRITRTKPFYETTFHLSKGDDLKVFDKDKEVIAEITFEGEAK